MVGGDDIDSVAAASEAMGRVATWVGDSAQFISQRLKRCNDFAGRPRAVSTFRMMSTSLVGRIALMLR